jgi:hypothetical protein
MQTRRRWLLAAVLISGVVGCGGFGRPRDTGPGPASYQRTVAEQFDPYPENEPGPPIVGARPREFQKPTPETPRVQWSPWPWQK